MTDLQKFFKTVAEDNDLLESLSGYTDISELATKAVELGAERSLTFTAVEVRDHIAQHHSEGELSESELDNVLGLNGGLTLLWKMYRAT